MDEILRQTGHRPYPLPSGPWRLSQRWNDLLFAHWPVDTAEIKRHLPEGLEVDTFDGSGWLGVVPFQMDQVRTRVWGEVSLSVPGATSFPELNLRTYVRSTVSGLHGVFFFSLDASSAMAVLGARVLFHLPYFWSKMGVRRDSDDRIHYTSGRLLSRKRPRFEAHYRSLGPPASPSQPGTLAHFLTERYCLLTSHRGRVLVGHIHHLPWPLEPAEVVIEANELPEASGLHLPETAPVLYLSQTLRVYLWPLTVDR